MRRAETGREDPTANETQVSYRHPLIDERSGARASRHPPQVARAVGRTRQRDEGGGSGSGSSAIRRFRERPPGQVEGADEAVARRFRGESRHKVDAKGRVSIPASFRRVLEANDPDFTEGLRPQLVIVYGDHRRDFLECFTMNAIEEVDRKIEKLPRASERRRMLERLVQIQSLQTEVDPDGRLVLPQRVREKIGLADEAYFLGSGDTFQIWKPETYDEKEAGKTEAWLDALPPGIDPLSMLDEEVGTDTAAET